MGETPTPAREAIARVLDFPTSFDAPTLTQWQDEMARRVLAALAAHDDHPTAEPTRYGHEDDVYGSCSCGETKRHHHDDPTAERLELAIDLLADAHREVHAVESCQVCAFLAAGDPDA